MSQQGFGKLNPDAMDYLKRIATGIALILWLLLTGILFWPVAVATGSCGAMEIPASFVIISSVVLAGMAAYLVCRLVFPVEYTALQNARHTDTMIEPDPNG